MAASIVGLVGDVGMGYHHPKRSLLAQPPRLGPTESDGTGNLRMVGPTWRHPTKHQAPNGWAARARRVLASDIFLPPPCLTWALQALGGDKLTSCSARPRCCRPGSVPLPGEPRWAPTGVTVRTGAGMDGCTFQPPSALCLGKAGKGEPRGSWLLPGWVATTLLHPVPLLSSQMRWLPPSEAGSQGWKSRQFC